MASFSKLSINSTITVPNSSEPPTKQPCIGWGSSGSKGDECKKSILEALAAGYRLIDTAQNHENEEAIGDAIATAITTMNIPRSSIFITTKIRPIAPSSNEAGLEEAIYSGIIESVRKLSGGRQDARYVDCFLIHAGCQEGGKWNKIQWKALERAFKNGFTKSIGISNAGPTHIEALKPHATKTMWPPHVVQNELTPFCQQEKANTYFTSHNIVIQAYSPLVQNRRGSDPVLQAVAAKYGKSTNQILVRYALQKGWAPLPHSENPDHIKENIDVFDFEIGGEDMVKLDGLEEGPEGALDKDAWAVAGREDECPAS